MSSRLVALLALIVAASSCSGEREGVAPAVTLRCEEAIERVGEAAEGFDVVGSVASLPTSRSSPAALQTSEHGGWDRASRLFAKTGLLVRAGRPFELVVPESFGDRVAIGWGSPGTPTHRLIVPACPSDTEWLAFAGGITVADPECITLEVVTDAGAETFEMGVGAPCPGQDPPPYPSDT